jgi:uncharacterized protein (DUF1501 family)
MFKQSLLKTEVDSTVVNTTFPNSGIGNQLKMVTRLMQTSEARSSKRDIFYVTDGGYDTHSNVDSGLITNFGRINAALSAFVTELKYLGLWNNVTLVQFTEFARTLDPNTGAGTDHGWGGVHFMMGGSVKGGHVLGLYPDEFEEKVSPIALSRGRMIPKYPWDAMWYGTAQWFGVTNPADMEKVLPMHSNFDASLIYDEAELFV